MARDEDNNIPSQMIKKPDVDEDYTALTGGIKKMKSLPDETNNDLEKELPLFWFRGSRQT